jgi:endonuclease G
LENKVRDWARRDSAICIAAGPVLTDRGFPKPKKYLPHSNKVVIPQYFYKVILSPFGDAPKAIGFIMPNRNSKERLQSFAVTVDSVEALTGIDFFSILPDDVERRIEASYNLQEWF